MGRGGTIKLNHTDMRRLALLALLLLPACQQMNPFSQSHKSFSRPVGPDPGGTIPAPTGAEREALLARVPDAHFAAYAQDAELRGLLAQLDALAGEMPDSARRSARALARDNSMRGRSPAGRFSEQEARAQEEQYLSWTPEQRLAYATQAMRLQLSTPAREDKAYPGIMLHHTFDNDSEEEERLRGAIGGYVGRTLMVWKPQGGLYVVDERSCSAANSRVAYERLMARCMLEDVAANRSLPEGTRCAAVKCLRQMYTLPLLYIGTGAHRQLISALPRLGAIPTLLAMGERRFYYTARSVQHEDMLRVRRFAEAQPRSAGRTAEAMAGSSFLRGRVAEQDLLRAEQQYKALGQEQRMSLAMEVMAALLTQPLTPGRDGGQLIRSYDALDVEAIRKQAGGIFAEEHPQAALLFKRMVARVLLEDLLTLPFGQERTSLLSPAAVACLRHICHEAYAREDGGEPRLYTVDALPDRVGLEDALFDGADWRH